jgi:hypothetical protein
VVGQEQAVPQSVQLKALRAFGAAWTIFWSSACRAIVPHPRFRHCCSAALLDARYAREGPAMQASRVAAKLKADAVVGHR